MATALALVLMLGLGALFLSFSVEYAAAIYSLLFGEVLGVPADELLPTAGLGLACILAVAILYRPLLLTSITPEVAEARGVRAGRIETGFLLVVALADHHDGAGGGGPADVQPDDRCPRRRPIVHGQAARRHWSLGGIALAIVWFAIAASYQTNWPVGFFVGVLGAVFFVAGRGWVAWRRSAAGRAEGAGHVATRPVQLATATGMSGEPT